MDLEEESNNATAENTQQAKTGRDQTPTNNLASGSHTTAAHFSTIRPGGMTMSDPSTHFAMPYPHSIPSCLMPESFDGSGDFEDYLQQFETCAQLSGWNSRAGEDLRPAYFALRLKGNALHFFSTLDRYQQQDFDALVEAFRQNYTTNVDILKARLKAAKQQPGQDIATFLCDVRTLARRAYRDNPDLIGETVLTSFIEGLTNSTLRWEIRKSRPRSADEALAMAIQLNAYLELENGSVPATAVPPTATPANGINQVYHRPEQNSTILFDEFVRSLKRESDLARPSGDRPHSMYKRNDSRERDHDRDRNRSSSANYRERHDSYERGVEKTGNDYRNSDSFRRNNGRNSSSNYRDNSGSRYGQRYDSYDRNSARSSKSVRFDS